MSPAYVSRGPDLRTSALSVLIAHHHCALHQQEKERSTPHLCGSDRDSELLPTRQYSFARPRSFLLAPVFPGCHGSAGRGRCLPGAVCLAYLPTRRLSASSCWLVLHQHRSGPGLIPAWAFSPWIPIGSPTMGLKLSGAHPSQVTRYLRVLPRRRFDVGPGLPPGRGIDPLRAASLTRSTSSSLPSARVFSGPSIALRALPGWS